MSNKGGLRGSGGGGGRGRDGSRGGARGGARGGYGYGSPVGSPDRGEGSSSRGGSSDRGGGGRGDRGGRGNRDQKECQKCGELGHFKKNCSWTPPTQDNNYNFESETENINTNTMAALSTVTTYVQDLANEGKVSNRLDAEELDRQKYLRGLRTDFGQEGDGGKIATNYLRIYTKIPKIYVYDIKMVREYRMADDGTGLDEVLLRDRHCKEDYFRRHIIRDAQFQVLRDNAGLWVCDYSNIWSVVDLFQAPYPVLSGLSCYDRSHVNFPVAMVTIERRNDVDLTRPIPQLFRRQTGTPNNNDDPSVLARGLNAIVTAPARIAASHTPTVRTQKTANKYFWLNTAEDLDAVYSDKKRQQRSPHFYPIIRALHGYFASVRPGGEHLLLNINTSLSPFFQPGLTVQDFIDRHANQVANNDQRPMTGNDNKWVKTILKGTRVQLKYWEDHYQFHHLDAKIRIVKACGAAPNTQRMEENHPTNQTKVDAYWRNRTMDQNALDALAASTMSIKITTENDTEIWCPSGWLDIITPQPVRGILRGKQTDNMIYEGQRKPGINAEKITSDGLTMFGFNHPNPQGQLGRLGISIGQKLIKIPARVLTTPVVYYNGGADNAGVSYATWNLTNEVGGGLHKFATSGGLTKMGLLNINTENRRDGHASILSNFGAVMMRVLKGHGAAYDSFEGVDKGFHTFAWNTLNNNIGAALNAVSRGKPVDATFVVLPSDSDQFYSTVKRVAEIDKGIRTVCVQNSKIWKMKGTNTNSNDLQYASNVAMKCNLKAAGQNHHLDPATFKLLSSDTGSGTRCDTIVLGADVAHPLKGAADGCPSIASVVGSVDDNFVNFLGSMRLQSGRQESIDKLADMVKERLLDWAFKHENRLPNRILFYRDGVSESQYDQVRVKELPQLKTAYEMAEAYLATQKSPNNADILKRYQKIAKDDDDTPPVTAGSAQATGSGGTPGGLSDKQPLPELTETTVEDALKVMEGCKFQVTYVVVGKRHNTRFYPTKEEDSFRTHQGAAVNGNVKPGLCVDQVITHPYSFDFYLQSHLPIQGTGRAAHYFVLINQMQLTSDELQQITHAFCYVYAKATRGVSYCAPAYYADRLCDRGRAYLWNWLHNTNGYGTSRGQTELPRAHKARAMRNVYNHHEYRPHKQLQKYGLPRRNPWHPQMDDIMFYL